MSATFVSVIIPVYNDRLGLRRTLDSLGQQSFPHDQFEIIVADNGSTDDTADVARSFATAHPELSIRVLSVPKPGSYAARNAAVRVAQGEVLAFTDSECEPSVKWIEAGRAELAKSRSGYAVGPVILRYKGKHANVAEIIDTEKSFLQEQHSNEGWGATANVFATRQAYDDVGGFREDLFSGGDYVFGMSLKHKGHSATLAQDAVVVHPARNTWAAVLKKRRRVAAGVAQRKLNDIDKLFACETSSLTNIPPQSQTAPRPSAVQFPFYLALKVASKVQFAFVYRETLRKGRSSIKHRA